MTHDLYTRLPRTVYDGSNATLARQNTTSGLTTDAGQRNAYDCDREIDDEDEDEVKDDARGDVEEESFSYKEHVQDALRCTGCKEVLNVPVLQASCGDRWHQSCYKDFKLSQEESSCPVCLEKLDKKIYRDVFAEIELEKLLIVCQKKTLGCHWSGERKDLEDHFHLCQYREVPCENGCQANVLGIKLEQHLTEECTLRTVKCTFCNSSVQLSKMKIHHENCLEVLLECKYGCKPGHSMSRQALNEHHKTCERRTEKCPIIDCVEEICHNELHTHFEDHLTSHIMKTNESVISNQKFACQLQTTIEENLSIVRQQLDSFQTAVTSLSSKVKGSDDQLAELTKFVQIKQQEVLQSCYKEIDELKRDFSVKSEAVRHNITAATSKLLILEEITVEQANKIETLERKLQDQVKPSEMSATQQRISAQDQAIAKHDVVLSENSLRIDIMDCKNTSGVLLWKIPDLQRRRRDAESGKTPSIYSQPFYTSPNGYKLCARLYLNGDKMVRGTHLSLFIVLMRGEYDSILKWPFQQKVTLMLIDQEGKNHITDRFRPDCDSSSFKRPTTELNVASGCPQFVSLALLDSGGYIRENSMFIKVIVDLTNIADPGAK